MIWVVTAPRMHAFASSKRVTWMLFFLLWTCFKLFHNNPVLVHCKTKRTTKLTTHAVYQHGRLLILARVIFLQVLRVVTHTLLFLFPFLSDRLRSGRLHQGTKPRVVQAGGRGGLPDLQPLQLCQICGQVPRRSRGELNEWSSPFDGWVGISLASLLLSLDSSYWSKRPKWSACCHYYIQKRI